MGAMKTMLPIAVSDIHVHLEARHVDALFGRGHCLSKWRDLAAARHIHMHPRDARDYGVADGQRVRVRVPGERGLVELLR